MIVRATSRLLVLDPDPLLQGGVTASADVKISLGGAKERKAGEGHASAVCAPVLESLRS